MLPTTNVEEVTQGPGAPMLRFQIPLPWKDAQSQVVCGSCASGVEAMQSTDLVPFMENTVQGWGPASLPRGLSWRIEVTEGAIQVAFKGTAADVAQEDLIDAIRTMRRRIEDQMPRRDQRICLIHSGEKRPRADDIVWLSQSLRFPEALELLHQISSKPLLDQVRLAMIDRGVCEKCAGYACTWIWTLMGPNAASVAQLAQTNPAPEGSAVCEASATTTAFAPAPAWLTSGRVAYDPAADKIVFAKDYIKTLLAVADSTAGPPRHLGCGRPVADALLAGFADALAILLKGWWFHRKAPQMPHALHGSRVFREIEQGLNMTAASLPVGGTAAPSFPSSGLGISGTGFPPADPMNSGTMSFAQEHQQQQQQQLQQQQQQQQHQQQQQAAPVAAVTSAPSVSRTNLGSLAGASQGVAPVVGPRGPIPDCVDPSVPMEEDPLMQYLKRFNQKSRGKQQVAPESSSLAMFPVLGSQQQQQQQQQQPSASSSSVTATSSAAAASSSSYSSSALASSSYAAAPGGPTSTGAPGDATSGGWAAAAAAGAKVGPGSIMFLANEVPAAPPAPVRRESQQEDQPAPRRELTLHELGQCTPCGHFFFKKCSYGDGCKFCHHASHRTDGTIEATRVRWTAEINERDRLRAIGLWDDRNNRPTREYDPNKHGPNGGVGRNRNTGDAEPYTYPAARPSIAPMSQQQHHQYQGEAKTYQHQQVQQVQQVNTQQQQMQNHQHMSDADAGDGRLLCEICYDREMSISLQPCGHSKFCWECISEWYDRAEDGKVTCPICREDVEEAVPLYM